jgi:16S rRNA (guanine(527)-N(7))-methyltransferase RsmG
VERSQTGEWSCGRPSPGKLFHVKHEGWDFAGITDRLTEEQVGKLEAFESLLRRQALARGMIAAADTSRLRERHILDSLRGAWLISPEEGSAIDMGSGAGLPGIPIAIARPDLLVMLAESRRVRAAFLESVIEELGLQAVRVHARPIRDLHLQVDVCLARAFGSADRSWTEAKRLLVPKGRLLYWAGTSFEDTQIPAGVRSESFRTFALARSGPVVMMSRQ